MSFRLKNALTNGCLFIWGRKEEGSFLGMFWWLSAEDF